MTGLKKTAGWILGLGLLAGMMIFFPSLTKAATSGDYEYTVLEEGTAEITKYNGAATDLEIPDNLDGIKVTGIGKSAFKGCSGLTGITIPSSVINIGISAFEDCSGLTSITIPSDVGCIRRRTFYGCCGLTSITIPDGVTSIGVAAFENCSGLTSITIPSGVKYILDGAFGNCSGLTSITIPSSVEYIMATPFFGCSRLTDITVAAGNPYYDSRNGCNAIIETKTNTLIAGCKNTVIPLSVTSIGFVAFYGCSELKSIMIPPCVSEINNAAFQECPNLKDVYYFGTEQEKNEIEIGDENENFLNANWHLNICPIASLGKWFYSWIWFVGGPRL